MQRRSTLRTGQPGGDVDDLASQSRTACLCVESTGDDSGRAEQVVGDRGAEDPCRVRGERPGRHVGERSVEQIGEDGFDDRVRAMGDKIGGASRREEGWPYV